jgi:hypothetical protein
MVRGLAPLIGYGFVCSFASRFKMLRGRPEKGVAMRLCASAQGRQKSISNEWRNPCPPKAQALPLIYRISARPVGSLPIEYYNTSRASERAWMGHADCIARNVRSQEHWWLPRF